MSTPLTSSTGYCTVDEFLVYCDRRTVARLLSDENAAVDDGDLADDPKLASILLAASGMLEAACIAGMRYIPTDLSGLTGSGKQFLKWIVSQLAHGVLVLRRPEKKQPLPVGYEQALDYLERLRLGERIFPITETAEAGIYNLEHREESDLQAEQLSTWRAQRLFGIRNTRSRPRNVNDGDDS